MPSSVNDSNWTADQLLEVQKYVDGNCLNKPVKVTYDTEEERQHKITSWTKRKTSKFFTAKKYKFDSKARGDATNAAQIVQSVWNSTPGKSLRETLTKAIITNYEAHKITKIVCLGLGTLQYTDRVLDWKPWLFHAATFYMCRALATLPGAIDPQIEIIFQDSNYVYEDHATCAALRNLIEPSVSIHEVKMVRDPAGWQHIDNNTLIFCPSLDNPYREMVHGYLVDRQIDPVGIICPDFGSPADGRNAWPLGKQFGTGRKQYVEHKWMADKDDGYPLWSIYMRLK